MRPWQSELPAWLTKEQVEAILTSAQLMSERDHLALLLTYTYGLRVSELVRLRRECVKEDGSRFRIFVERSKGSRSRWLPVLKNVQTILIPHLLARDDKCPWIVIGREGQLSTRQGERIFSKHCATAGVELPTQSGPKRTRRANIHILRHSVAVHLRCAKWSLQDIADWLGHKDTKNTEIYAQLSDGLLDDLVCSVENLAQLAG